MANRENIIRHDGFAPEKPAKNEISCPIKRPDVDFYILLRKSIFRPYAFISDAVQT